MLRTVMMIFRFFRELVFDSKEEYDFRSSKFNGRKVLIFVLAVGSFVTNIIQFDRAYKTALENVRLMDELKVYKQQKNTSPPPSDSARLSSNSLPPKPK